MKKLVTILLCMAMLISFAGCKDESKQGNSGSEATATPNPDSIKLPDVVKGHITVFEYGTIEFEIYPNLARQSCLNFIYLASNGYYNGMIVNRVIKDGIVQMGKYRQGHTAIETEFPYTIKGEFEKNGVENTLNFTKGTMVWMLNDSTNLDSASTEFGIYVTTEACHTLKGTQAAFGTVTKGLDVVQKISTAASYNEEPSTEIIVVEVALDPVYMNGSATPFTFPEPNFIKVQG